MYENIPIFYVQSFKYIDFLKIEKENDLIFQNALSPNIFFKNIKKIDEILNFIKEDTNINDILNKFYEEKKYDGSNQYYDFKN